MATNLTIRYFLVINRFNIDMQIHQQQQQKIKEKNNRMTKFITVLIVFSFLFGTQFSNVRLQETLLTFY